MLGFTAVALSLSLAHGQPNPGFHGVSQVFYEYVSAFANNGSGFEGLGDDTYWWNLSCTLVLILGRYPALIVPLAIAGLMARKKPRAAERGAACTGNPDLALTPDRRHRDPDRPAVPARAGPRPGGRAPPLAASEETADRTLLHLGAARRLPASGIGAAGLRAAVAAAFRKLAPRQAIRSR